MDKGFFQPNKRKIQMILSGVIILLAIAAAVFFFVIHKEAEQSNGAIASYYSILHLNSAKEDRAYAEEELNAYAKELAALLESVKEEKAGRKVPFAGDAKYLVLIDEIKNTMADIDRRASALKQQEAEKEQAKKAEEEKKKEAEELARKEAEKKAQTEKKAKKQVQASQSPTTRSNGSGQSSKKSPPVSNGSGKTSGSSGGHKNHGGWEETWSVDKNGKEISGTRFRHYEDGCVLAPDGKLYTAEEWAKQIGAEIHYNR